MRTQSYPNTGEIAINRYNVAEFISRLGQEMALMADALLRNEKREASQLPVSKNAIAAFFSRSSWLTSGADPLPNRSKTASHTADVAGITGIFLKSSWLTSGADPRCN